MWPTKSASRDPSTTLLEPSARSLAFWDKLKLIIHLLVEQTRPLKPLLSVLRITPEALSLPRLGLAKPLVHRTRQAPLALLHRILLAVLEPLTILVLLQEASSEIMLK